MVREAPRRGRPPRLRRDEVLDTATDLGLRSFTVGQLAARLGVSEGAMYHHFAGRDDIEAAACGRLFAGVDTELSDVRAWPDYLEHICDQIRTIALDHDGFGQWLVGGAYDADALQRFDRILQGLVQRAPHLDPDTAYLVGSQAVACTVGLVASGFVGSVPDPVTPADRDDQYRWMLRSLLRGMADQLADGVPPPRRRALRGSPPS